MKILPCLTYRAAAFLLAAMAAGRAIRAAPEDAAPAEDGGRGTGKCNGSAVGFLPPLDQACAFHPPGTGHGAPEWRGIGNGGTGRER